MKQIAAMQQAAEQAASSQSADQAEHLVGGSPAASDVAEAERVISDAHLRKAAIDAEFAEAGAVIDAHMEAAALAAEERDREYSVLVPPVLHQAYQAEASSIADAYQELVEVLRASDIGQAILKWRDKVWRVYSLKVAMISEDNRHLVPGQKSAEQPLPPAWDDHLLTQLFRDLDRHAADQSAQDLRAVHVARNEYTSGQTKQLLPPHLVFAAAREAEETPSA